MAQKNDMMLQEELQLLEGFDKELMKQDEYGFMMTKFLDWFFWGITVLTMLFPWSSGMGKEGSLVKSMGFFALLMGTFGLTLSMAPYVNVGKKKDNTGDSIYKLLRYMPISCKTIYRSRMMILGKKIARYGIGLVVAQILAAVIGGTFSLATLLYPLIVTAILAMIGIFYVSSYNWVKTDNAR